MLGRDGVQPVGQVWTGGEERVPMECAAHKALDLVGDIACAIGYLPALRIVARDAGHTLHAKLSRALRNANSER
jgi:UDP-3-O-acyl-N-acetylglucosamine deacetylase